MRTRSLLCSIVGITVLCLQAHAQSITATTAETNTRQFLTTLDPIELTLTSWNFTGQTIPATISFISITLTLQDGNTAPGDFDFDHLFLVLDMINTGLRLNGFPGGASSQTLTISGFVTAAIGTQIRNALVADNMLVGTIITDNAQDSAVAPNDIFVGNDANNATTTLTLAVPEPGTWALLGVGLAVAAVLRRRS